MPRKKVNFSTQPDKSQQIEEWVVNREVENGTTSDTHPAEKNTPKPKASEKMKRLTIDIPPEIHRKLKAKAALEGTTIVELVRPYLEELVKDL